MARNSDQITPGSGNVFADIGMPDPETHAFKAGLVSLMRDLIDECGLKKKDVAVLWRFVPADVSHVLRGRFRSFSIDRLFRFMLALNQDLEVRVKPRPRSSRSSRLTLRPVRAGKKIAAAGG